MQEIVFSRGESLKMTSPSITPKKEERIAQKAAETVLSQQGQVVIQANTPEMLPGLTGQKVVELWPVLCSDVEKRAHNTEQRHHKTLIEPCNVIRNDPIIQFVRYIYIAIISK